MNILFVIITIITIAVLLKFILSLFHQYTSSGGIKTCIKTDDLTYRLIDKLTDAFHTNTQTEFLKQNPQYYTVINLCSSMLAQCPDDYMRYYMGKYELICPLVEALVIATTQNDYILSQSQLLSVPSNSFVYSIYEQSLGDIVLKLQRVNNSNLDQLRLMNNYNYLLHLVVDDVLKNDPVLPKIYLASFDYKHWYKEYTSPYCIWMFMKKYELPSFEFFKTNINKYAETIASLLYKLRTKYLAYGDWKIYNFAVSDNTSDFHFVLIDLDFAAMGLKALTYSHNVTNITSVDEHLFYADALAAVKEIVSLNATTTIEEYDGMIAASIPDEKLKNMFEEFLNSYNSNMLNKLYAFAFGSNKLLNIPSLNLPSDFDFELYTYSDDATPQRELTFEEINAPPPQYEMFDASKYLINDDDNGEEEEIAFY